MARKYNYSRMIKTPYGDETFTASEFDSFDEARAAVDRGINDRKLMISEEQKKAEAEIPATPASVPPTVVDVRENAVPASTTGPGGEVPNGNGVVDVNAGGASA